MPEAANSVLSGYTVLDFTIAMAGPLAGQRLGDLGADVIKVEPLAGEWQRHTSAGGAKGNRINVSFLSMNRNKRSIAIDMKHPKAPAVIEKLVRSADVFLQNYRPGVAQRLGVDYDTLAAINPALVYVSVSGYGESGPMRDRPGQDLLLQGMSGAMYSNGAVGQPPTPAGQYLADATTASTAFEAVLAGLLYREKTGQGQLITVNMLDVLTTLQMQELSIYTVGQVPQVRSERPHGHVYIRAPYGAFETADGHIVLAFPPLAELGAIIGEESFATMEAEEDGWTRRDEIWDKTQARLKTRPSQEWLDLFDQAGLWAGPVLDYAALVDNPQIKHNGTFVEYDHPTEGHITVPGFPYQFSKSPATITRPTPLAGEHTREILREIGFDDAEAEALFDDDIVVETCVGEAELARS